MSMVSANGDGSLLTRLPPEVISTIAARSRAARLLMYVCRHLRENLDASFLFQYDALRNGFCDKLLYDIRHPLRAHIWNILSRGLGDVGDGYKRMLVVCIHDVLSDKNPQYIRDYVQDFLSGSVDGIELKIKTDLPILVNPLNRFLEKIESLQDPARMEIMKRFIGYMSLFSLTSTLDSSQKEILRQFSNKVINRMLSSYNFNFWDKISGFVNFLETLSRQCLLYKKNDFPSGIQLNLPEPEELLAFRAELIDLLMKDYLDYELSSLIISLDCPIKKGPFSFKIGQNLKYLVKDDPQSHIVIAPEFVYLGKSCQEGEYSKGVQFKKDGSTVYGLFHNEQCEFSGTGVLVFPNKKDKIVFNGKMVHGKFKGGLIFDLERNEYLNLLFDNGLCWKGYLRYSVRFDDHLNYFKIDNYKDAIYHGSRVFYFNGDVYKGQFENGLFHGYGKLTYSNGAIYEGQFENGLFHGYGKLTYSNGCIYEGQFENGKTHGKGKQTSSSGGVYEGEFQHGKFHGQGKLTKPSFEYEGQFQHGKFHGQGKLTKSDGEYIGNFKNGKCHGQGKLTKSDGEYIGDFKNGKRHGQGKLNCSNGNIKEGEFKDNKLYNGQLTIEEKTFYVKDGVNKDVLLRRSSRQKKKRFI